MSKKRWTEREMIDEISYYVEQMGGWIEELDFSRRIFKINIDPAKEEEVMLMIDDILNLYSQKRSELAETDPFSGIYDVLADLGKLEDE